MDLPSKFEYQGWTIRYSLIQPGQASKRVVFVHGTPWSSAVYKPVIEALKARGSYEILVYDLPGYGQSQVFSTSTDEKFPGDTSVKFQAEALAELLKHTGLGSKKPAVVAHDIAGTIVLRAHLFHGCDFASMLLADANAVLPWGDGFYKLARSQPDAFLQLPPTIFEAVVRSVIQSALYNPRVLQRGWEDILADPWLDRGSDTDGECQKSFVRQIAQANDADVAEMLEGEHYKNVRCEVKIVWGEDDQWIPKNKIEELITRLNGHVKERAYIPEAGHLVMLDQPERFSIEVYDWLQRS